MRTTLVNRVRKYATWHHVLAFVLISLLVLLNDEFATLGVFVFANGCTDSCATDDSSCSSGGSSDSGGGSDAGGNCGCNSSNCGMGECTSGCTDSDSTSTPYLYVKKQGVYEMQNDVMVGYPVTAVLSREQGEEKYRTGMLGNDIYHLSLSGVDRDSNAQVLLRLKEIEEEESFIYRLRTHAYVVPEGRAVMPSWDHIKLIAYDPTEKQQLRERVLLNGVTDCTDRLRVNSFHTPQQEQEHSLRLSKGDALIFTVSKEEGNRLVVSSFWRDWNVGDLADEIHGLAKEGLVSPFVATISTIKRAAAKMAVFATVFVGAFLGQANTHSSEDTANKDDLLAFIKKCNSANIAYADSPHTSGGGSGGDDGASLLVSYRHPDHGAWIHSATIQPRAYMPVEEYVVIRDEAYDQDGKAHIKIEATKGHYVKHISLMPSDSVTELTPIATSGIRAVHSRGENVLETLDTNGGQDQTEPIHLIAGDTLDITTSQVPEKANYLAIELLGFYTPLTAEGQRLAGNWNARLDAREHELIASMYG